MFIFYSRGSRKRPWHFYFELIVLIRMGGDRIPGFPINVWLLPRKFAACSKQPSRDNDRKASYPRTQTTRPRCQFNLNQCITTRVVAKTTTSPFRPRCRRIICCNRKKYKVNNVSCFEVQITNQSNEIQSFRRLTAATIFLRKELCCPQVQWRGDGPRKFATCFGAAQRV